MPTLFSLIACACIMAPIFNFSPCVDVPKYFAVDIDGTFYSYDAKVLTQNIATFHKVLQLGITLFFCTGRPHNTNTPIITPQFVSSTGFKGCPGIYYNGAFVVDEHCSVISCVSFPKKFQADLIDFVEEKKQHDRFIFFDGKSNYMLQVDPQLVEQSKKFGFDQVPIQVTNEQLKLLDIIYIIAADGHGINTLEGYTQGCDYIQNNRIGFTDLNPPGACKVEAIAVLSKHFGVKPEDIAFIGDGVNDVELLKQSNISFAVANAVEPAKQSAKYVLDKTCDEAGFSEAMSIVYKV